MKKTLVLAAVAAFSAAGVVASPGVASAQVIPPPSVPPVVPAVLQQVGQVTAPIITLDTRQLHDRVIYTIQPVCNALGFVCS